MVLDALEERRGFQQIDPEDIPDETGSTDDDVSDGDPADDSTDQDADQ